MFDNKLRKEIIEKVKQGHGKAGQVRQIEAANPKLKAGGLLQIDAYTKLWKELEMIDDEVKSLLIEIKYYPLGGVDSGTISTLLPFSFFSEENKLAYDKTISDEAIEKYLDIELMTLRDDMKRRLRMLRPLVSTFEIDAKIRLLYKQIARSFTYGMFESTCILCRVVAEDIAKKVIEGKIPKRLLYDCAEIVSEETAFQSIENLQKLIYEVPNETYIKS